MSSRTETASPDCAAIELAGRQRGVAAVRPIEAGETVLVFGGPVVRFDELRDFTHALEIAPGVFLGPSGGLDDLVNHSCDPNCAVRFRETEVQLYALRTIGRGEELNYDYSTVMLTDPTTFPCECGASDCRGTIRGWIELPAAVREAYLRRGLVPPFVASTA